jgi:precorrin-3B synthase
MSARNSSASYEAATVSFPIRESAAGAGAPACAAAEIPTRALAPAIAAAGAPLTVHISGCAKGCAYPGPAALTIVGIDGKCGLVRNGRAQDRPRQLVEIADLPANVGRRAIQEADHG